jgi:hypothetical protein
MRSIIEGAANLFDRAPRENHAECDTHSVVQTENKNQDRPPARGEMSIV